MRTFALIPAAGNSIRMGQAKLLLSLAGAPLLVHTIKAWQQSKVDRILVVARPGDDPLANVVRSTGVELVVPATPPPDMKASLQVALRHIEQQHTPTPADAFLVAPADMPRLSPVLIDHLIEQHSHHAPQILVPTLAGRRGHPVLFPWTLAKAVYSLAANEGLDAVVHRHQPHLVACDGLIAGDQDAFSDIDTPDQYRQAAAEYQQEVSGSE